MNSDLSSGPILDCGLPLGAGDRITLAHGGGGRLARTLVQGLFSKAFGGDALAADHDSSVLPVPAGGEIAFSTDSFVVNPLFFPGGDIGRLAVFGTANDLAMSGARPLFLSLAMILEEGLPMATLHRLVHSIALAAREAGVEITTGDTKVVERGKADGLYLNTSGIGRVEHSLRIRPDSLRPGDALILSGDLGRHGIAVMAARAGLEFERPVESDCALLFPLVQELLAAGIEIRCLRDLTRGGLNSALHEISLRAGFGMEIEEGAIPVAAEVQGACEFLGLDPMLVANEGRFLAVVPADQAKEAVARLRRLELGSGACVVGRVTESGSRVKIRSRIGVFRYLEFPSGDQLPRIC
jgi:hydrogenase expression/formation protein HypE